MWTVELQLHAFLISTLNEGEWVTSRPSRLTPEKEARYTSQRRLGGSYCLPGHFGEEGHCFLAPEFELPTVQPVA
jgi:hypothetical protein